MESRHIYNNEKNIISNIIIDIEDASSRIYKICKKTPLDYSELLSSYYGSKIFLKREYEQYTGSFKLRGASNKILKLYELNNISEQVRDIKNFTVVTASTGNHGSAVAYASSRLVKNNKIEVLIYSTNKIDKSKAEIIEMYGGNLIKIDSNDSFIAEQEAIKYVKNLSDHNTIYISPYNDYDIISGQGTIGKELINDMENIDAIFISVGGGGLISGISCYVKSKSPNCKIIACQPENSCVMYESIKCGNVLTGLDELDTLSDGTAGGVDENTVTFPIIQTLVDEFVLATESEIMNAMLFLIEKEKIIVEGSAALTLACFVKTKEKWINKNAVLVLCGKNISLDKLKKVFS